MDMNLDDNDNNGDNNKKDLKRKSSIMGVSRFFDNDKNVRELKSWVCRGKCLSRHPLKDFYIATDPIDAMGTGRMSVCRFCVNDLYHTYLSSEKSFEKAIYRTCKDLNVLYEPTAVEVTRQYVDGIEAKGGIAKNVFGVYRKNLNATGVGFGFSSVDNLSFRENTKYDAPPLDPTEYGDDVVEKLVSFWGEGMEPEDYSFLERELSRFKKTHKCDTAAEESLLREICFCTLDIRKMRQEGKSVSNGVKMLQELMKTASVDPAKTSIAGAGKSQDTFSSFIKTIEENEPAEYYKDKKLFKDFDNIEWYFEKYVSRPLKNFITLSRDFNVDDDSEDDEEGFDITDASENM